MHSIQIQVAFFGPARQAVPVGEMAVRMGAGATLAELLDHLAREYGTPFARAVRQPDGQLWPSMAVVVNGHNAALGAGLATELQDGDQVAILPVITGG